MLEINTVHVQYSLILTFYSIALLQTAHCE